MGSTRLLLLTTLLGLAVASCGGDSTGPGAGGGPMSALIDGSPWQAAGTPGAIQVARTGQFIVIGASSANLTAISLSMPNVTEPGTYALVPPTPYSGHVNEDFGDRSWISSLPGGSGSVTITSVTATRIVGTFEFDAVALPTTTATGTRVVTNGQFDLEL